MGRLLLNGAFISWPVADALRIGEKKGVKSIQFTNNPQVQSEDVLFNPRNPVNPDSKPGVRGKFILKPDDMNDLTATNAIVP